MCAGGRPDEFWDSTFATVMAVLQARRDRDEEQWKQGITQAWVMARLTRAHDMPDLETLIGERERSAMSDEQIGHNIALWGAVIDQQFGNGDTSDGG